MSILGTVVRTRPDDIAAVSARIRGVVGADLALDSGDGRLIVLLEDAVDAEGRPVEAAASMAAMAQWPEVLGVSLVYEYSGPDAPAPEHWAGIDFRAWRDSVAPARRGPG